VPLCLRVRYPAVLHVLHGESVRPFEPVLRFEKTNGLER
jgi:hypothetical protein